MEPRSTLKNIREFAMRELREKRADRVCVRRVKLESLMKRGWLPDLRIRWVKGVHYLVCVFHGKTLRAYYMGARGESLGASEFAGTEMEGAWSEVLKTTKNVFSVHQRGRSKN